MTTARPMSKADPDLRNPHWRHSESGTWDARWTPDEMDEAVAFAVEAARDAQVELEQACHGVAVASQRWTDAERWAAAARAFRERARDRAALEGKHA